MINKNGSSTSADNIAPPALLLPAGNLSRPRPHIRQKALERWASELPIGNTTVAAHQMLEKLKSINASRYPYRERLALHNTLRPVFDELLHAIRQPLRQTNLPLNQQQLYRAQLLQDLLKHMAMGYKYVANELCQAVRLREYDRLLLTESVYLAISYLAHRLVDAYAVYAPEPIGVWSDLNQLYKYAEASQITAQPVDDPYPDSPIPVSLTIEFAYKRILLLALAEPYHLMQYEADELFGLVSSLVGSCLIDSYSGIVTRGEYILDLDSDRGPRFTENESTSVFSEPRIVDITTVKLQLNVHLQRLLSANMQHAEFEAISLIERQQRDMLLRLADAWNASLVRKNPRFSLSARIELATGINAAHYYISDANPFTPEMDELRLVNNLNDDNSKNDSVIATAYREAIHKDRKHRNATYPLNPWWQKNVSPIGVALNCKEASEHLDIRVGELVTYRVTGKEFKRWQIGVTRWLKHEFSEETPDNINIGILNLANGAIAIGCKALSGLGSGTDYFRGLMIPNQVSLQQTRSLIVPALLYDVGTVLMVNMKQRIFYARLSRVLLSTRSFTQFDFTVIKRPVEFHL